MVLLEIKILCMPEAICQNGYWCFNKLTLQNSNSMCTKQNLYQDVNCSRQDIYDLPQNKTYHLILNFSNATRVALVEKEFHTLPEQFSSLLV